MNHRTWFTILRIPRKIYLLAVICLINHSGIAQVSPAAKSGYAAVNGLKLYYEVHGEGKPIILLHGAFMTINTAFSGLIPELSRHRKVIAVELQGHGRTADIDRPFSFESMADDIAGLIKYLQLDSADVFGYSLGGGVALQMAIRHPELVNKLILVSAAYQFDGWTPETRSIFPRLKPEMFIGTPIKKEYDSLAPDPKHWSQFVNKLKVLIANPYDFTAAAVQSIKSPTLLIIGDGDGVMPEHAVAMYRLLGGRMMPDFSGPPRIQMAIFPGTSHISAMMHPDWMLAMLQPFLNANLKKSK